MECQQQFGNRLIYILDVSEHGSSGVQVETMLEFCAIVNNEGLSELRNVAKEYLQIILDDEALHLAVCSLEVNINYLLIHHLE